MEKKVTNVSDVGTEIVACVQINVEYCNNGPRSAKPLLAGTCSPSCQVVSGGLGVILAATGQRRKLWAACLIGGMGSTQ